MDIFVSLAIIVALAWGISKIHPGATEFASDGDAPNRVNPSPMNSSTRSTGPQRVLSVEGTQRVQPINGFGFVKGFGLNPEWLSDLVRCTGPGLYSALPLGVQNALRVLYADGSLHGTDVVSLLGNEVPLPSDKAIYIAMITPPSGLQYAIGFVDSAAR